MTLPYFMKRYLVSAAVLLLTMPQIARSEIPSAKPSFKNSSDHTPSLIDAGPEHAYRSQMAFDYKGDGIAVFEQMNGGVYKIYAALFLREKGWLEPVIISDSGQESKISPSGPYSGAYSAKVVFDGSGNAIAVFKKGGTIYANRYAAEKGWEGPVRINSGTGDADGQQVVFDNNGNGAVVFEQFEGQAYRIYVNRYIPGKGWQMQEMISKKFAKNQKPQNAYFPYPAFDNRGNLSVIYYKEEGNGIEVYINRYDEQVKKWGKPVRITDGLTKVKQEKWKSKDSLVAMGVKGVYNPLFWNEIKKRIYSGTYDYKGWETPSKVDSRYRDAYRPSIVIDKKGAATALFVRWDGEHLRGYAATYTHDNRGWSKPVPVDGGGKKTGNQKVGNIEHLRAAINAKGEIAIVFSQWAAMGNKSDSRYPIEEIMKGNLRVYGRIYDPSSGWGEAKIIDAGARDAYNPTVVFTAKNEIVVTWCQWEKVNVKSYYNTFKKGTGWGKAVRLERDDEETCGVKIFAGSTGTVIAIFEQEVPSPPPGRRWLINRMFAVELVN